MNKKTYTKPSTAGFTLIEVLVIIIIIGVLFAIAAPGWLAFINRQRVGAVRNEVAQALRQGQAEARRTRSKRIVQFLYTQGSANDPAQVNVGPVGALAVGAPVGSCPPPASTIQPQVLGGNSIRRGQVRIAIYVNGANASNFNSIVFDERGNVSCIRNGNGSASVSADNLGTGFMVTAYSVRQGTTTASQQRCVIVSSILGSIQTDDGAFSSGRGCRTP